jgi:hypothetical protein
MARADRPNADQLMDVVTDCFNDVAARIAIKRGKEKADVVTHDPTMSTSTSGRRHLHWWTRGTSSLYSAKPWRVLRL